MNTPNNSTLPDRSFENLKKLKEIREKYPTSTHIFMQRNDIGDGQSAVEIQMSHAEMTIRTRPKWEVLMSNHQMDTEIEKLFDEDVGPTLQQAHENAANLLGETELEKLAPTGIGIGEEPVVLPPKPSEEKPVKPVKPKANAKPRKSQLKKPKA